MEEMITIKKSLLDLYPSGGAALFEQFQNLSEEEQDLFIEQLIKFNYIDGEDDE